MDYKSNLFFKKESPLGVSLCIMQEILDASPNLYKTSCPTIGWSVGWSAHNASVKFDNIMIFSDSEGIKQCSTTKIIISF